MTTPGFLDLSAIAERLDLTYATVRGYHTHAQQRRAAGTPKPGDFPPPDHRFGRTPVWLTETIDTWEANRPGRGAGGGRPWHKERERREST